MSVIGHHFQSLDCSIIVQTLRNSRYIFMVHGNSCIPCHVLLSYYWYFAFDLYNSNGLGIALSKLTKLKSLRGALQQEAKSTFQKRESIFPVPVEVFPDSIILPHLRELHFTRLPAAICSRLRCTALDSWHLYLSRQQKSVIPLESALISVAPTLKSFHLRQTSHVLRFPGEDDFPSFPQLTQLHITCQEFDPSSLALFLRHMPVLRSLVVKTKWDRQPGLLPILSQYPSPSLRTLSLLHGHDSRWGPDIVDVFSVIISRLPLLREVHGLNEEEFTKFVQKKNQISSS